MGVDRQRHRRIVGVPGRDDVHWHAAGQHKADAGITEALEVDAAQAGLLTQALEFVGVPLMADGGAVLACRDQTEVAAASPRLRHALIGFLADSDPTAANQQGVSVQRRPPQAEYFGATQSITAEQPVDLGSSTSAKADV